MRKSVVCLLALIGMLLFTGESMAAASRAVTAAQNNTNTISDLNEELAELYKLTPAQIGSVAGTDTITGSITPSLTSYQDGQKFVFKAAGTNTGAVTLNIDSIGAKAVVNAGGSALSASDLLSGTAYLIVYLGGSDDHFRVITALGSGVSAPTAAQYVVLALSGSLSAERVLTAGAAIDVTDGGANGNATVDWDATEVNSATWGAGAFTSFTFSGAGAIDMTWDYSTSDMATYTQTDAGAAGPILECYHNSASPAASDVICEHRFDGEDSAGNTQTYARERTTINDATSTSEDGTWSVGVTTAGTTADELNLTGAAFAPTTDEGLTLGTSDTLRFSSLYLGTSLELDKQAELRFFEAEANGDNKLVMKAPAAVTSDQTCTLEDDANFIPDTCVGDGSDDDVPEVGDFTNLVGGSGIDNNSGTLDLDTTEISSATWGAGAFTSFTFSGAGAIDLTWNYATSNSAIYTQTDAGAAGPILNCFHDSASPAASDVICEDRYDGRDSAANLQTYARTQTTITDATSTSEDAKWSVGVTTAGTMANELDLLGASFAPTTDKGLTLGTDDTLRFSTLFGTNVYLDDNGSLRIYEAEAGGDNYKEFIAPAAITANTTCTLEDDANFIPDSCVGDGSDDDVPETSDYTNLTVSWCVALSDETTAITTGSSKTRFVIPYAFTVTGVSASLSTVSSSGAPAFDINEDTDAEGGTAAASILSTTITIDANERRSSTAAVAAVVSDSSLAANSEILFDIDTAGTGAAGAKVCITGHQT